MSEVLGGLKDVSATALGAIVVREAVQPAAVSCRSDRRPQAQSAGGHVAIECGDKRVTHGEVLEHVKPVPQGEIGSLLIKGDSTCAVY